MIHVFGEAPLRVRAMPAPRLFALVVPADLRLPDLDSRAPAVMFLPCRGLPAASAAGSAPPRSAWPCRVPAGRCPPLDGRPSSSGESPWLAHRPARGSSENPLWPQRLHISGRGRRA
ncbi:unnamed protein product [Prorocentrum cordatum]|uniref:Uncharacterized protein n=1 Tax=Prorocentrum cordatum TaxID=2364126 RepID=A0ABN9T7G6_9DINO|nr:unnamed protein product [Polarella glacialis]